MASFFLSDMVTDWGLKITDINSSKRSLQIPFASGYFVGFILILAQGLHPFCLIGAGIVTVTMSWKNFTERTMNGWFNIAND